MKSEKINIGPNVFVYPMPMSIVGTMTNGKENFLAVGWIARVNGKPPIIGVSLNRVHYTNAGIIETGTFSVNFPGDDLIRKTDYVGIVSGKTVDKSNLFEVFYGELSTAPMICECPLAMECRLTEHVKLPTHDLFLGEIINAYSEEQYLTNGIPDMVKMRNFVLTMPDNHYWSVGTQLDEAWKTGKILMG